MITICFKQCITCFEFIGYNAGYNRESINIVLIITLLGVEWYGELLTFKKKCIFAPVN